LRYARTDARTSYCLSCHTTSNIINGPKEGEEAEWPLLLIDIKFYHFSITEIKTEKKKQAVLKRQTNTYIRNAMNVG